MAQQKTSRRSSKRLEILRSHYLPDGNFFSSPDPFTRGLINEIYFARVYDRYFSIQEGMSILDVGAHAGIFTLKAAKLIGSSGKILAIEANPELVLHLRSNVAKNGYENVTVVSCAVSNQEGTGKLVVNQVNMGSSALEGSKKTLQEYQLLSKIVEVPVRRLDALLDEFSFHQFDLAKLDIEGFEFEALEGLGSYLQRIKRFSIASYHYPEETELLSQFLHKNGFKIFIANQFVYAITKTLKTD